MNYNGLCQLVQEDAHVNDILHKCALLKLFWISLISTNPKILDQIIKMWNPNGDFDIDKKLLGLTF